MTRSEWRFLGVEVAASVFTLLAIFLGTTTLAGAGVYLVALVFWYWLIVGRRMWGLLPLNVGVTVLCVWNLSTALGGGTR